MEECAELQKEASKALRFGLNDICYKGDTTTAQNMVLEFEHVMAMMEMLQEDLPPFANRESIEAKKEKVEKWAKYSIEQGRLSNEILSREENC